MTAKKRMKTQCSASAITPCLKIKNRGTRTAQTVRVKVFHCRDNAAGLVYSNDWNLCD
jgi:hypothetical protein